MAPGQFFRERGFARQGARIAVCSGTRDVGPHRLSVRCASCSRAVIKTARISGLPASVHGSAKNNTGAGLRFLAHDLLIRSCIMLAQATDAAF